MDEIRQIEIHGRMIPVGETRLGDIDAPIDPVLCPVCGKFAFAEHENYDVCPFCGWENDSVDNAHENCSMGPNHVSVIEARKNYKKFGAVDERSVQMVRAFQEQFQKGFVPHNGTMYRHINEFVEDADPVKMIKNS